MKWSVFACTNMIPYYYFAISAIETEFMPELPQKQDVIEIIASFIRIQKTYNLTAPQMAMGKLFGFKVETLSGIFWYL